jgi:hypothetical protein
VSSAAPCASEAESPEEGSGRHSVTDRASLYRIPVLTVRPAQNQSPTIDLGTLKPGEVEVGEPKRTYTVEPLEEPVPREVPSEPPNGPSEEPSEPDEVEVE